MVYRRLISSYRSASSLAACSTSSADWRIWVTTGRRKRVWASRFWRAALFGALTTSQALRGPLMPAAIEGPSGVSMATGPSFIAGNFDGGAS